MVRSKGFIAAETGDNACIGGDIIPTLTLAIPGSAPAAVLLAAMTIHNLRPGPLLVAEQPAVVGQIIAISMVSTVAVFVLSLAWTRQLVKILLIPRYVLMPTVFIICVTGAFALSGRLFDIYVMFAFGLLGVVMQELDYPVAPLVLGFISGPMAEDNLRRGLMITGGRSDAVLRAADLGDSVRHAGHFRHLVDEPREMDRLAAHDALDREE